MTREDIEKLNASGCAYTASIVDHPGHYNQYPLEVIDIIRRVLGPDGFKAYCLGNILKYRLRAGFKGDVTEDIKKADKYLDFINMENKSE